MEALTAVVPEVASLCRYTFYYYFCRSDMSGFMQVSQQ